MDSSRWVVNIEILGEMEAFVKLACGTHVVIVNCVLYITTSTYKLLLLLLLLLRFLRRLLRPLDRIYSV
jgi:hypothetical protein